MVNTPEWDSDFFAQIQSTQDLLSKELNICLVLVNNYCKEITLPSSLPLICHEAESSKANCLDYYVNLIKQISNGKQLPICTCPKGLYSTILQSSIKNNGPLYLIAGRTENLFQLNKSIDLLKAIFSLPFASTFPPMVKKQANLTSPVGLTFQETKILSFIVSGLSNKDIAFKLCISQSTVKTHVANIFKKLGLVNRTEASIYAVKNGLISGDNNVQK